MHILFERGGGPKYTPHVSVLHTLIYCFLSVHNNRGHRQRCAMSSRPWPWKPCRYQFGTGPGASASLRAMHILFERGGGPKYTPHVSVLHALIYCFLSVHNNRGHRQRCAMSSRPWPWKPCRYQFGTGPGVSASYKTVCIFFSLCALAAVGDSGEKSV